MLSVRGRLSWGLWRCDGDWSLAWLCFGGRDGGRDRCDDRRALRIRHTLFKLARLALVIVSNEGLGHEEAASEPDTNCQQHRADADKKR